MAIFNGTKKVAITFNGVRLFGLVGGGVSRFEEDTTREERKVKDIELKSEFDTGTIVSPATLADVNIVIDPIMEPSIITWNAAVTSPKVSESKVEINVTSKKNRSVKRTFFTTPEKIFTEINDIFTVDSFEYVGIKTSVESKMELSPIEGVLLLTGLDDTIGDTMETTLVNTSSEKCELDMTVSMSMNAGALLRFTSNLSDLTQTLSVYNNMTISEMSLK